jgi:hypothetical protein
LNNKYIIYYWSSDTQNNSGEGILGNLFIYDIKRHFKGFTLININKKEENHNTFHKKYILNFIGALKLWKYYLSGHKILYVNYLPIWNFFIFLILPPQTILGPITGSLIYNQKTLLNFFLRRILLNIAINISLLIIFWRYKKILFSTELLKTCIKKNQLKKVYFNYALKSFRGFSNKKTKRNIDFLIYHRDHNNKNNSMVNYFIKNISDKKYKILVIGDKINSNNIKNMGYVDRSYVKKLLQRTKYTFGSSENLYTLFVMDAISKDVLIFYDQDLNDFNTEIEYNKMVPLNFKNKKNSLKFLLDYISKFKKNSKKNFFKKKKFNQYFQQQYKN